MAWAGTFVVWAYCLMVLIFSVTRGSSSFKRPMRPIGFGEVERFNADPGVFQQFFAETHRVKGHRARAQHAEAGAAHPARDPAHRRELAQVGAETLAGGINGVQRGQRERNPVLAQVVAGRHLAAKAVAPVLDATYSAASSAKAWTSTGTFRFAKRSVLATPRSSPKFGSVTSTPSISVAVRFEQVGALVRIAQGVDTAIFGIVRAERDDVDPFFFQNLEHRLPPGLRTDGWGKIPGCPQSNQVLLCVSWSFPLKYYKQVGRGVLQYAPTGQGKSHPYDLHQPSP